MGFVLVPREFSRRMHSRRKGCDGHGFHSLILSASQVLQMQRHSQGEKAVTGLMLCLDMTSLLRASLCFKPQLKTCILAESRRTERANCLDCLKVAGVWPHTLEGWETIRPETCLAKRAAPDASTGSHVTRSIRKAAEAPRVPSQELEGAILTQAEPVLLRVAALGAVVCWS